MTKPIDPSRIFMNHALDQARKTMNGDVGGPFGALIVDENGQILAVASNSVLRDHDPTAHAEINAIRQAGIAKGTHDLSGCVLYTTCYPCPMCMGAILWSNIRKVVYGCRKEDAGAIGFRDDFMYAFLNGGLRDSTLLALEEKHRDQCLSLFEEYRLKNKTLY